MLEIVATEHVRFARPGESDPNSLLFAALQSEKARCCTLDLTHQPGSVQP